jgi:hypothetical protein
MTGPYDPWLHVLFPQFSFLTPACCPDMKMAIVPDMNNFGK